MKRRQNHMKSKFSALENNFLNTFFSGNYISANEFIEIGKKVDIHMGMNSRELLIKELLNKSDTNGTLDQVVTLLETVLDERINTYHELSKNYTATAGMFAMLVQKTKATKSLLNRETQRNPYE